MINGIEIEIKNLSNEELDNLFYSSTANISKFLKGFFLTAAFTLSFLYVRNLKSILNGYDLVDTVDLLIKEERRLRDGRK